jgi:tellurite resistance protein TerC
MTETPLAAWVVLGVVLLVAIIADLEIFGRRSDQRTGDRPLRSAFLEIGAWIGLSILFGLWIGFSRGWHAGADFFSAYLIEKSLSVDNIFLFLVIFRSFGIAPRAQHKVLYSGIAGALVLRGIFVFGGLALLQKFHFVLYVFGALLVVVGFYMLTPQAAKTEEGGWLIRFIQACVPATKGERAPNDAFFVRSAAGWRVTSLLMALIAVELADVVFALDSVPAVLAVTRDPFIAYSSNIFAILGLRAMYFGIAAILPRFRYLHQGLAAILLFVGGKMVLSERYPISGAASLLVVAAILSVAILASWLAGRTSRGAL